MSSTLDEYYYSHRLGFVWEPYSLRSANQLIDEANTLLADIREALKLKTADLALVSKITKVCVKEVICFFFSQIWNDTC